MAPDPKRSIATFERRCQDLISKAERFINDHKVSGLTIRTSKFAEAHVVGLEEQFQRMNKKWQDELEDKAFEDSETLHAELDKRVTETKNQVDKCVEDLQKMLEKNDSSTVAAAAVASKALKLDNSFKPQILPASSNLEEFYSWERSFLGHHQQNKTFLEASSPQLRQLFVTDLLDSKLQSALVTDSTVTEETPIVGTDGNDENSILSWVKRRVLRHKPLFIRRFEYSNCQQKPREPFGDWWTLYIFFFIFTSLDNLFSAFFQIRHILGTH